MNSSKELLNRMIRHLILHSSFLDNIGLYHGKLGVALCLYHYAKHIKDPLYNEIADDLLEQVLSNIPVQMPIDFANGICGIGWGICYLLNNRFVEGNANEILKELDMRILEYNPSQMHNLSLETGIEGMAAYLAQRQKAINNENESTCMDIFIQELEKKRAAAISYEYSVSDFINKSKTSIAFTEQNWFSLGLHDGCAGKCLLMMMQ